MQLGYQNARAWHISIGLVCACLCARGDLIHGCSFLVTSRQDVPLPKETAAFDDPAHWNFFMKLRGPDLTNHVTVNKFLFLHNLLHMTGEITAQPFYDDERGVVALFNGEIYNYKEFGNYTSDGQSIIGAYHKFGERFTNKFRGEFAIVLLDFQKEVLVVSTDVFAIKPVWVAIENGNIGIASYESALKRLSFSWPVEQAANRVVVRSLKKGDGYKIIRRYSVFDFDLRQHKASFKDWDAAFTKSMQRRTEDVLHGAYPVN